MCVHCSLLKGAEGDFVPISFQASKKVLNLAIPPILERNEKNYHFMKRLLYL